MDHRNIIAQLSANRAVYKATFAAISTDLAIWRPHIEHWSILEIACHLADEEREDFRARLQSTLEDPARPWPSIDPQSWITGRNYAGQSFQPSCAQFLAERDKSAAWLDSLETPHWQNTYTHPELGLLSAEMMLANWLAHDYLHLRQINRIRYAYLKADAGDITLHYAGNW